MVKNLLDKRRATLRQDTPTPIKNPELIFGLVGPIGVDLNTVISLLQNSLADVGYNTEPIHLTELMRHRKIRKKLDFSSYFSRYESLIAYANAFRKLAQNDAALAGVAILKIRELRAARLGSETNPALGCAFIIRQFKRPEEIELMRRVYGRKFIQVSVYGSASERRGVLIDKIRHYDSSPKTDAECERQAIKLIDMDHNQKEDDNGQRLSDVFHLGDVFVDGIDPKKAEGTIRRFVSAFFGDTKASPTKDEYGLYIATAAALRSVDLSRQVGAAIFSKKGEVISLGCNEVPKAGGGTYWTDDNRPLFRDVEIGADANQERRNEILFDLVERLGKKFLSRRVLKYKTVQKRLAHLLEDKTVKDAQVMDIIEFGRIIHAEMSALSDAARTGKSTRLATLFCTTFPCHLCAKHIVAAGIERVVFLEPYPKSYAQKLHGDSITFERGENISDDGELSKVLFQPFIGISPRRYRDIFEKRKRKDDEGRAKSWYEGEAAPLIEDRSAAYIENEEPATYVALKGAYQSRRRESRRPKRTSRA